jgi:hypothetical protein
MKPGSDSPQVGAASARLMANRERMARWLAADRQALSRPALGALAVGAAGVVWPLIQGLRAHPAAPLALGVLGQARRYPKTALALIGLATGAWWLARSHHSPPQP